LFAACLLFAACTSGTISPLEDAPQAPDNTTTDANTADTTAAGTTPPAPATASVEISATDPVATATNSPTAASEPYPTRKPPSTYADLEMVTLLPRDAIPAIDNPQFLSAEEADEYYDPDELVMGVSFNGESRAYSAPFLSNHEIVNDTVGGVKIAVTW
jgi:hypothetical protein